MSGFCAKRHVIAVIVPKGGQIGLGKNYTAFNICENPQKECPRKEGEDYTKCREICGQRYHAEELALAFAGEDAMGATLYLKGHDHCCERCIDLMKRAGIRAYHVELWEDGKYDDTQTPVKFEIEEE